MYTGRAAVSLLLFALASCLMLKGTIRAKRGLILDEKLIHRDRNKIHEELIKYCSCNIRGGKKKKTKHQRVQSFYSLRALVLDIPFDCGTIIDDSM